MKEGAALSASGTVAVDRAFVSTLKPEIGDRPDNPDHRSEWAAGASSLDHPASDDLLAREEPVASMSNKYRGVLLSILFVGVLANCSESPTEVSLDDSIPVSLARVESPISLSSSWSGVPAPIVAALVSLHAVFDAAAASGAIDSRALRPLRKELDQIGNALKAKSNKSGKEKKSCKGKRSAKKDKLDHLLKKAADKLKQFLKKLDTEARKGRVEAATADALRRGSTRRVRGCGRRSSSNHRRPDPGPGRRP
jgi:hypothetical protein